MLSSKIAKIIAEEMQLDKEKQAVINYGAFMLIQAIVSIALVVVLGVLFEVLPEALIVSFTINILRQYSGGAHASKPSICLVIGTTATIAMAYAAHWLGSTAQTGAVFVAGVVLFIWAFDRAKKYIPVDSKAKPIVSAEKKARMRRISFVILTGYALIALVLLLSMLFLGVQRPISFALSLYAGVAWQTGTLTITGRKILAKADNLLDAAFFYKKEKHK